MFTVYRGSLRIKLMQVVLIFQFNTQILRTRNIVTGKYPYLQKLRVIMRSVRRAFASRCCSTRRRSSLRVRLSPRSEGVGDRVDSLRSTLPIRRRKRAQASARGRPRECLGCRPSPPFPPPLAPRTSLLVVPPVPTPMPVTEGGPAVERCCLSENVELHCESSLSS